MGCDCNDRRTWKELLSEYLCAQLEAGAPVPQIDVEHHTICNEDTNTWQYVTIVYTDGVAGAPTTVDSGIACSEPQPIQPDIEKVNVCDATTNTIHVITYQYSYPDPTDLTNVVETQLSDVDTNVPCNTEELDLIKSNWLPICVDGSTWYVRDISIYNNATGSETGIAKEYKEGANGAVTATAPTGTIVEGYCKLTTVQNTLVSECFEDNANAGTFQKVFKHIDTTTFPATIVGYTEEDFTTIFDTNGWTRTDDCNCNNC